VVLCDVLLGWGAHPDPGTALVQAWKEVQAIARAAGRHLIGIATVCGTPDDPQGYERQCQVLQAEGFILAESNAQAVRLALAAISAQEHAEDAKPWVAVSTTAFSASDQTHPVPRIPEKLPALLTEGPKVINLGLQLFTTPLLALGIPCIHVHWSPPAGGDIQRLRLLERLRQL
jgi:FdrA protein